jgi:hypothetical protein
MFAQYCSYFIYPGVYTFIPVAVISVFGFLILRHMRTIVIRRSLSSLTWQMIYMALFHILDVLLFNGHEYLSTSATRIGEFLFSHLWLRPVCDKGSLTKNHVCFSLFYSYFYCYCLSKRFRDQLFTAIKQLTHFRRINQALPLTQRSRSHIKLQT